MTPATSLDYLTLAIRHDYDAGSISLMHNPLAILARVFERLGRYEQATTIIGFAATPMARAGYPRINATITQSARNSRRQSVRIIRPCRRKHDDHCYGGSSILTGQSA
jgi:hypothetical protein